MKPFIRKGKSKSGATTVQIVYKEGRQRKKIKHIGSAHNEIEEKLLVEKAEEIINANQLALDLEFSEDDLDPLLENSYSKTL